MATAVDLGSVRSQAERILEREPSAYNVGWLVSAARVLARRAVEVTDEAAVLRELVDDLESRLAIVDAERLAAIECADRRLRELSEARVSLMAVELYARKARC